MAEENNAKLYNNARFSDLLVKFSGRKIKVHRVIICHTSAYFDKLCGPESQFAEANQSEIELQGDDPDALEAMLRHLYGIRFTPPVLSLETNDKVRYYYNLVVVADKYDLPSLACSARRSLETFVTSMEEAKLLFESLVILTDEYPDYNSLEQCATTIATSHLKKLSSVPDFAVWLAKRVSVVQDLIDDATEFRTNYTKFKYVRPTRLWLCHHCQNLLVGESQPKCCGRNAKSKSTAYINISVKDLRSQPAVAPQ